MVINKVANKRGAEQQGSTV